VTVKGFVPEMLAVEPQFFVVAANVPA